MRREEIKEGDIVEIDFITEFTKEHINEGKALVIWKGFNHQPLVRKLNTKTTICTCYEHIARIVGHIDIEGYMDKVLEQQPCEDCISREQTLKAFAEKYARECACCEYNGSGYDNAENCKLIKSMPSINAVIIPEGATNGDMMKAVLPIDWESKFFGTEDKGIQIRKDYVFIHLKNDVGSVHFTKEWWNSPYKAESEDKKDIERQMWDDFHELTAKYYYYINAYEDMTKAGLPPCFTPRLDAKYIKCLADGIEQALGAIVTATKDLTERSGIDGEQRGQG